MLDTAGQALVLRGAGARHAKENAVAAGIGEGHGLGEDCIRGALMPRPGKGQARHETFEGCRVLDRIAGRFEGLCRAGTDDHAAFRTPADTAFAVTLDVGRKGIAIETRQRLRIGGSKFDIMQVPFDGPVVLHFVLPS